MSTRSALAFKTKSGWYGIYCHYDGYPTHRGKQIWDIVMNKFILNRGESGISNKATINQALQSFVDIYIKGHRGGWSNFPGTCYCHSPDFVMRDGNKNKESFMSERNSDALFIEWVYVINPKECSMEILTSGRSKGQHEETSAKNKWMQDNYTHYFVDKIIFNPDIPEPNWEFIEATGGKISNSMYEKFETKKGD